jgi:hypothetical protein
MPMEIVSGADNPFNPYIFVAYDINDVSKGGEIRRPVAGCSCFHNLDFKL